MAAREQRLWTVARDKLQSMSGSHDIVHCVRPRFSCVFWHCHQSTVFDPPDQAYGHISPSGVAIPNYCAAQDPFSIGDLKVFRDLLVESGIRIAPLPGTI
jgi:hypothetical protein